MSKVIVFDVNETLLDLSALKPHFRRVFGDAGVIKLWFSQMLQSSLVATVTGAYASFDTIGAHALEMTAERKGVVLSQRDRTAIRDGMLSLPPHPEVPDSLARLKTAGLRLATLTNSTSEVAHAQLDHAGLMGYFESVLSVEDVRMFKPAPETYRMAAKRLHVQMADIRLVAAHNWDISGALRAGCAGAFVARPGMVLGPLDEKPDIVGKDLAAVVIQILANDIN